MIVRTGRSLGHSSGNPDNLFEVLASARFESFNQFISCRNRWWQDPFSLNQCHVKLSVIAHPSTPSSTGKRGTVSVQVCTYFQDDQPGGRTGNSYVLWDSILVTFPSRKTAACPPNDSCCSAVAQLCAYRREHHLVIRLYTGNRSKS